MSRINFSIIYNRKKKLNKNGEALIHVRANQNGKSIYFKTDIYVKPKYWNENKKEIRATHPHSISLNREIEDFKNKLIDLSQTIKRQRKTVSLELLRERFKNSSLYNSSFIKFYEIELENARISNSTYATHKSTLRRIKEFRKELLFSELDFELLTEFTHFYERKGIQRNTIGKYIRHIKKYVNLAINKNLIEVNETPFKNFSYKSVQTRRKFLQTNEIIEITKFVLPEKYKKTHQRVLDAFLFALYTGLRKSDIESLKKEHVKHSLQNGYYIEKDMVKTKEYLFLPLEKLYNALRLDVPKFNQPMEIINRNKKLSNNELIFNKINSETYSKIKEVFKLANINYVGFHGARHAIAMYLLNDVGLDLIGVSQVLGHKNLKTTAIYSQMTNKGLLNRLEVVSKRTDTTNHNTQAV